MRKQLFILGVIASLIAAPVLAAIETASSSAMNIKAKYAKSSSSKLLSAQQAARIVKNKFGGKELKVSNSGSKNSPSYRVKLLKDNGHVISVNVDGQSGRVSGY